MILAQHPDLQQLLAENEFPCISIYLPATGGGVDPAQNAVRFRKLLSETESALAAHDGTVARPGDLLGPLRELLQDTRFWNSQRKGLALFLSPGYFRRLEVSAAMEPIAVLADRFHVVPLLIERASGEHFYILALSKKEIRLFQAGPEGLKRLELGNAPASLPEEMEASVVDREFQHHARKPGGTGRPHSVYHGTSFGDKDQKSDIHEFFHRVAQAVESRLAGRTEPMVLAGVEYVTALYRQVSGYPQLAQQTVAGSPKAEAIREDHLLERARQIVRPHFQEELDHALQRYRDLAGTGRVCTGHEEVVTACREGRVETLFLARSGSMEPGGLIDRAAVPALTHGSRLFFLDPARIPDGRSPAAILRY